MGYYTHHNLEIIKSYQDCEDHKEAISKSSGYQSCFDEAIKWYSHQEDMKAYSKLHPDIVFKLSGEGEEAGDLWIEYYQNGKIQSCKASISYDDFDPDKLI